MLFAKEAGASKLRSMIDPRVTALAQQLCSYSCKLNESDTVLLHMFDIPEEVTAEFVRVAYTFGAKVLTRIEQSPVRRARMMGMTEANAQVNTAVELYEMQQSTAYIALRGSHNNLELSDVPGDVNRMWAKTYVKPVVFETRVPNTKWVALRWPNPSFAQMASMSTEAFEDFYFRVCLVDYAKMAAAAEPLRELMDRTDRVRITGPGTDLSFSIKGVGSVPCSGEANVPDGECFSSPLRESMNGTVQYNTVSLYEGTEFTNIFFRVKDGQIVEATAGANTEALNKILDTDPGARYFGEWSLGYNPHVLHPMKDTLFDEKIGGSFHLTPGNAYEGTGGNGNESNIHWDIVCIQRAEYGGGDIYFDDVLIRKDGIFVLPELAGLNPDQLGH